MEPTPPTNGVRIGGLDRYVEVYRPSQVLDPAAGGWIPGDPELVLKMFAAVEPTGGQARLEQLAGGQLTNQIDAVVTCWYHADLTVAMFLEFDDGPVRRHLEILDIRDPNLGHRYQELYCQERV